MIHKIKAFGSILLGALSVNNKVISPSEYGNMSLKE